MFLSTQSVSRPKRDSIYSFMRHSGPLGCITTEIFSENHCCLKRRFSENLDSTVSTGQLEQKMTLFAIFQDDSCGQSSWKIVKNRSHIAKFGCGSGAILVILFKKIGYFFSKIRKKWKKWKKNILKIINITHSIYAFMYVLKKEEKKFGKILKKYFSQFQSIFRIPVGQRWRWRWRWRWKIFHGEMLRKWNGIVPTYVEAAKKILGNIPNVKFFRADTYFGGTQNLGQPEKHFFDTFFQFRPWRGPKCDQNQLWHVNIAGNLH